MADYKALPYRAAKELHKVGDQQWVILTTNEKGKNYEKPDLINLDGSKSIMGFVNGDSHYLLFQATDALVAADGKPSLAKCSFSFSKKDGTGWETDEVGQKEWKTNYESSNRWVALLCDFPILKTLAKWLHESKLIISDLVYLKNLEVDEKKLFEALDSLTTSIAEDDDAFAETPEYAYLEKFGIEGIEFEEKVPRNAAKLPPVEKPEKNADGFLSYEKVVFSAPTRTDSTTGGYKKQSYSESEKANSKLDFLLANADKIKQLFNLFDSPEQMIVALGLTGVEVPYFSVSGEFVRLGKLNAVSHLSNIPEEASNQVKGDYSNYLDAIIEENGGKPEKIISLDRSYNLQPLIDLFGDIAANKWFSELEANSSLDSTNTVSTFDTVSNALAIVHSKTFKTEPKNVLTWAKEHLDGVVKSKTKTILDLSYIQLAQLTFAVTQCDLKIAEDTAFSILDLKPEDLDIPAF